MKVPMENHIAALGITRLFYTQLFYSSLYETFPGKTKLMDGQKEQALIRRRTFCEASDQSLDFLSHMNICRKHVSRFLHNLKTINEYKNIDKGYLGKHCLLLHKQGFPR